MSSGDGGIFKSKKFNKFEEKTTPGEPLFNFFEISDLEILSMTI